MKSWILAALVAGCLVGCESTDGIITDSPVANQVELSGSYYALNEVDQPPVTVRQVAPQFPSKMRKARMDGKAIVVLVVNAQGKPEQIQAEQATHSLFAEAAVAALRKWEFKPAMKGGQPVAVQMTIPMEFRREYNADYRPAP